jgi:hypothetical protein
MANDPTPPDPELTPDNGGEEPKRPSQLYHPGYGWPGDARMETQQAAAHDQFKRNSAELQNSAAERDNAEIQPPENAGGELGHHRTPSMPNYAELRDAHTAAAEMFERHMAKFQQSATDNPEIQSQEHAGNELGNDTAPSAPNDAPLGNEHTVSGEMFDRHMAKFQQSETERDNNEVQPPENAASEQERTAANNEPQHEGDNQPEQVAEKQSPDLDMDALRQSLRASAHEIFSRDQGRGAER